MTRPAITIVDGSTNRSLKGRCGPPLRSVSSLALWPSLDPPDPALIGILGSDGRRNRDTTSDRRQGSDLGQIFSTSSRAPASPAPAAPAFGGAAPNDNRSPSEGSNRSRYAPAQRRSLVLPEANHMTIIDHPSTTNRAPHTPCPASEELTRSTPRHLYA